MFYHGSPSDKLELDSRTLYLTQSKDVARAYAHGTVAFCSKSVGDKPTVYSVVTRGTFRVLDLRRPEAREWYAQARACLNKQPAFEDDQLPKIGAVGFIQATGLPGYGVAGLFKTAFAGQFDAVLLDEGSQGVSLAVFNPAQTLTIVGEEKF
jgi:hypothetical protein